MESSREKDKNPDVERPADARVSVIIPTYNHAVYITRTVDSVLQQTLAPAEVIVVDDGSTDNTGEVLAPYLDRITYLRQANQGPAATRNNGIRHSSGDYLMFLDADDWIEAQKIELQVNAMTAHPEWGVVYCGWHYVDQKLERVLASMRPNKQGALLKDWLLRSFFFPPGAALVRRECIQTCGLFDEELIGTEDTDFWVRIAKAGYLFGYVDEILFNYRVVQGSLSNNLHNQIKNEFLRLDKFYAQADLSEDVLSLKPRAYAILRFEAAAKYYLAGEVRSAQDMMREGARLCPDLAEDREWLVEWLAGAALEPRVAQPTRFMDTVIGNLPKEITGLRDRHQKAVARYHIAAAFTDYHNRDFNRVKPHILPAIFGDPSILLNRGFIRIALRSLLAGLG